MLDIRYLRGGSGDFGLFDVLKNDPRVNRKGGLTVLMGRENVSVATLYDYEFDVHTQALLVGEPTPARADNFRQGSERAVAATRARTRRPTCSSRS